MNHKILFHEYLEFRGLNVNELNGEQYSKAVSEYELDVDNYIFPLNKNNSVRNYLRGYTPEKVLQIYRYIKSLFTSIKAALTYLLKSNKYKYSTIYIAAGNRCASTWLKELLIKILDGYDGYHPHSVGAYGGNFDINYRIAKDIRNKLYVICSHTPPKYSNKRIMDQYLKKYISTIRDPRDVVVSLYYHIKKYPCGPTSLWDYGTDRDLPWPTLPRSILNYEKSKIISILIERIMPSIISFMEGWVNYSLECNNILLIKYEDLKLNTCSVVQEILKFYDIVIDENKIKSSINDLNPKNNKDIYINYSSGRVPETDKYYSEPHTDWDKHLNMKQQRAIEKLSATFFPKVGYVAKI